MPLERSSARPPETQNFVIQSCIQPPYVVIPLRSLSWKKRIRRLNPENDWEAAMRISTSTLSGAAAGIFALAVGAAGAAAQSDAQKKKMQMWVNNPQADGYLEAHKDLQNPPELMGGPVKVSVSQDSGGVFVILPSKARLDPHITGTPDMPRWNGGTPGISSVPIPARGVEDGQFTRMKQPSPFGDKVVSMGGASLQLEMTDITATDGATTKDKTMLEASWQDQAGNTYTVKCCKMMASHGLEWPTFGGVATNHLLHGFSGVGTPLMPTEFTYAAFWGMGSVSKNGEVLAQPRMIHGMLTEYVRTQDYKLAKDSEVDATRRHFHLMVPPMKPVPEETRYEHSNVKTGFELPNGKELPFWHVMFEDLEVSSE